MDTNNCNCFICQNCRAISNPALREEVISAIAQVRRLDIIARDKDVPLVVEHYITMPVSMVIGGIITVDNESSDEAQVLIVIVNPKVSEVLGVEPTKEREAKLPPELEEVLNQILSETEDCTDQLIGKAH